MCHKVNMYPTAKFSLYLKAPLLLRFCMLKVPTLLQWHHRSFVHNLNPLEVLRKWDETEHRRIDLAVIWLQWQWADKLSVVIWIPLGDQTPDTGSRSPEVRPPQDLQQIAAPASLHNPRSTCPLNSLVLLTFLLVGTSVRPPPTRLVTVGDRAFLVAAAKNCGTNFPAMSPPPSLWLLSVVIWKLFCFVYHIQIHNLYC